MLILAWILFKAWALIPPTVGSLTADSSQLSPTL